MKGVNPAMRTRTPRSTVIASALLALALLGGAACKAKDGAKLPPATGEGAAPLPTLPKIVVPGSGSGTASLPAVRASEVRTTGTLVARSEITVGPRVGGLIAKIAVAEGDTVKKGQLLFQIDASVGILARNSAKAALAGAQVQVDAAQVAYDRAKALFEKGALPQAQWDQAQTGLAGAKVGVQAAQATLAMASKMVADATVTAPMKGVVTTLRMHEGEYAQMMPPSVVLVLQDRTMLELQFRLPEAALAVVGQGDQITAVFSAVAVTRPAKIARINPSVDARTRTIELVAVIDNHDDALKPGLLAEVVLGAAPAAETAPAVPPPSEAAAGSAAAAKTASGAVP